MLQEKGISGLLGTPETSLSGRSTRKVLSVFKLMLSSEPAGRIMGKNLEKKKMDMTNAYLMIAHQSRANLIHMMEAS